MRLLSGTIAAAVTLTLAAAADWPRFRGPNGTGVGEAEALPVEFGPAKNLAWKTALPPGHSSPVIVGDRIYLTAFEGEKLLTVALDRATGTVLWRRECPRPRKEPVDKRNSPTSPSPVADSSAVYVFFPDFGMLSYTPAGVERWRLPLGPFNNMYGMGASPVLAGGIVVLVCDQAVNSFIVGVGKDDGKIRWKRPRPEALSGHSTPVVYPSPDGLQVIAPSSFRMDALSANTGEIIWFVRGLASEMKSVPVLDGGVVYINGYNTPENDPGKQVAVASFDDQLAKDDKNKDGKLSAAELSDAHAKLYLPFLDIDHDGALDREEWRLFALTMSAENGLLAIRPGGKGDVSATAYKWKYHKAIPQLPSTVLYRNVLYMINDAGVLTTLDPATGTVFKQARLRGAPDKYFSSPVAADGKVYFVSVGGTVTVLEAGPDQKLLAVNELDGESYATPAIAGNRIYFRTSNALYCFGRGRKESAR